MINQEKLAIMTKLAVYDKTHGDADRSINAFYRHDFIYKQNIWNRLSAFIGSTILLAVYWLHRVFIVGEDIFTLNLRKYATNSIIFIVAFMAAYTAIGTVLAARRYSAGKKRLEEYQALVAQLDSLNERVRRDLERKREEAGNLYYGATADRARDAHRLF